MARARALGMWALAGWLLLLTNPGQAQVNPEAGDVEEPPPPSSGSSFSSSGSARAQTGTSTGSSSSSSYESMNERPRAPSPPSSNNSSGDDHMAAVGAFGIGFFGVDRIPIMDCGTTATCMPNVNNDLAAPTIGMRLWMQETVGLELAVGLRIATASNGPVSVSQFGMAVHAGLPLALAHASHFVFELVPQMNIGFSSGSFKTDNGMATDKSSLSGFLIEAGAKAGAEIHFGFMGLPQLSLQGTLGLMFRHESRSAELPNPAGNGTTKSDQSATTFATGVDGSPWDIFQGAITAIYYFY